MANVKIVVMVGPTLFDGEVPRNRATIQTCGFIPLAWTTVDRGALTLCLRTPPYCIIRDTDGTLWLCDSRPHAKLAEQEVVWRRADATELDAKPVAAGEEARNA